MHNCNRLQKKVQNLQISLYLNDFYTFYITTSTATTITVATAAAVGSDFHEKCKQNCRGSEREREAEELSPYGSAFASTALRGAAFVKGKWTQRNATQRNEVNDCLHTKTISNSNNNNK